MSPARLTSLLALSLAACGGTVVFEEPGETTGGDGGASGVNVSVGAPTTVGPSGPTTTIGVTTGEGAGDPGPGPSVTVGSSGTGGGSCSSTAIYAECLGRPECVPVFDDFCCSDCFPGGGCGDCSDPRFVACVDRLPPEPGGSCGVAPCGFIPDWACSGGAPSCSGDSCPFEPGCVQKLKCDLDVCEVTCDAVRADACGPVLCNEGPPDCPQRTVPEAQAECWSGACVPAWVCSLAPPL